MIRSNIWTMTQFWSFCLHSAPSLDCSLVTLGNMQQVKGLKLISAVCQLIDWRYQHQVQWNIILVKEAIIRLKRLEIHQRGTRELNNTKRGDNQSGWWQNCFLGVMTGREKSREDRKQLMIKHGTYQGMGMYGCPWNNLSAVYWWCSCWLKYRDEFWGA